MKKPRNTLSGFGATGFTLVELLVVLALSSLLSTALFQIVKSNRQNITLADSYSKVQESGRYAMDYVSKDIRMAGYMSCVNTNMAGGKITNQLKATDTQYVAESHDFTNNIVAIDNYDITNIKHPKIIGGVVPVKGTDIFTSNAALATEIKVKDPISSTSSTMTVMGPANQLSTLLPGMVLMITDCNTAHIFAVSNDINSNGAEEVAVEHKTLVSKGPDNTAANFGLNYGAGSQILIMNRTTYFIGPSRLVPGQTSLYRFSTVEGAESQELVPYVEDMQLTYSVDTTPVRDRTPDVYKTAAQIATDGNDMTADVYSVNVDLTLVGEDIDSTPATTSTKQDGKFRKRYTRVVGIRNAGFSTF